MYTSPEVVLGFHGCDRKIADTVIKEGKELNKSENEYDWLGHGIYFWEGSNDRALEWARENSNVRDPAVIGAIIKLGNCIDLLDTKYTRQLKKIYETLEDEAQLLEQPLPVNRKTDNNNFYYVRELDCRVVMRLHETTNVVITKELQKINREASKVNIQNHHQFIDSVRGMFPEGDCLYPNAGFREKNHIQLCIVNPNCIIGYFEPRDPVNTFKKLY